MVACRIFTETDRFRLGTLLASRDIRSLTAPVSLDELEWLLEESSTSPSDRVSPDVVTMNSRIRLVDTRTGRERTCTVVYPQDVELIDGGVSVLGPIGSSLIGHKVGDRVECRQGDWSGQWRIAEVLLQPERYGATHL